MVYNVNKGNNNELLDKCAFLKDYMIFIEYVRYYYKDENVNLDEAIEKAIDRCINEDIMRDFLIARREEVAKVTNLDFTFERQIELEREEAENKGLLRGREEGLLRGREEGLIEERIHTLLEFNKTPEECIKDIIVRYNLSEEIAENYFAKYGKS